MKPPRPRWRFVAVVLLTAVVMAGVVDGKMMATRSAACSPSEFTCSNSDVAVIRCVPAVKYCDGHHDCPDGSDEPQYCTREYRYNATSYKQVQKAWSNGVQGDNIIYIYILVRVVGGPYEREVDGRSMQVVDTARTYQRSEQKILNFTDARMHVLYACVQAFANKLDYVCTLIQVTYNIARANVY